jgi:hypothetical protein
MEAVTREVFLQTYHLSCPSNPNSGQNLLRRRGPIGIVAQESQRTKIPPIQGCSAVGNPLRDELCRYRREEYSVSVVAGGDYQSFHVRGPENR